jgi:hypothetical protein
VGRSTGSCLVLGKGCSGRGAAHCARTSHFQKLPILQGASSACRRAKALAARRRCRVALRAPAPRAPAAGRLGPPCRPAWRSTRPLPPACPLETPRLYREALLRRTVRRPACSARRVPFSLVGYKGASSVCRGTLPAMSPQQPQGFSWASCLAWRPALPRASPCTLEP